MSNILLNYFNINNFNSFIDILDNLQYESEEIIIYLFQQYLNNYKIIVYNDTVISNLLKILHYIFTYITIKILQKYHYFINEIKNNKEFINLLNNYEYNLLFKIINNNFREEDLKIFINYKFKNINNNINNNFRNSQSYINLQNYYKVLYHTFNFEQIKYIITNLNIINDKYKSNYKFLYNKLNLNFNKFYKNINLHILCDNLTKNYNFYLLYDIIYFIMNNIYNE